MKEIKTFESENIGSLKLNELDYKYGGALTTKLDELKSPFTQEIINEVVLWKVNRYVNLDDTTLELLNKVGEKDFDDTKLLEKLLNTDGIRLPMASTILRFKNPDIYQIIDQRAYRFLTGAEFKESSIAKKQIELYREYLEKLIEVCEANKILFRDSDRIFYLKDIELNSKVPLKESKIKSKI